MKIPFFLSNPLTSCDCEVAGLAVCALKPEIERPLTEEGKLQLMETGVALRYVQSDIQAQVLTHL